MTNENKINCSSHHYEILTVIASFYVYNYFRKMNNLYIKQLIEMMLLNKQNMSSLE